MQTIGNVRVKVNNRGIVEALVLEDSKGTAKHISLDRFRALFKPKASQNVTRIVTIEKIGQRYHTNYTTIPGRHKFGEKELQLINESLLQQVKNTGRQSWIIIL